MHPDRGIVRKYILSDDISTKLDNQNTLTRQSNGTNNAPRDLLQGPVTWNPDSFTDMLRL